MSNFRADPLLGVARALLVFIKGVLVVAAAAVLVALPAAIFAFTFKLGAIARDKPELAQPGFIWALAGLLVVVLVLLAAMWFFVQKLKQIVDSVATGDPFVPENAERLKAMAWTSIAMQVIGLPLAVLAALIAEHTHGHSNADIDISMGGVVLPVVLFILARVFRIGAAMREELEGTV